MKGENTVKALQQQKKGKKIECSGGRNHCSVKDESVKNGLQWDGIGPDRQRDKKTVQKKKGKRT